MGLGRYKLIVKLILLLIYTLIIFILLKKYNESSKKLSLNGDNISESKQITNQYEEWIKEYEDGIVQGLGADGKPVKLYGDERLKGDEILKTKAINLVVSDKIPLDRELPDVRDPLCKNLSYENPLPSASIIIIFYNEPWSVLLRTVVSVLNNTPMNLLKEIILVDDHSDEQELQGLLQYYIETRLSNKIKLIRNKSRLGLIRARLNGAKIATGDVLVFLDAHCEVTFEWITPLLQRIKEKRNTILLPIIDTISEETFEYMYNANAASFQVGGFTWSGHFTWINIQQKDLIKRESSISPVESPTMAGGLFAVDRNYFWEIGSYDDQMDGWGGENLEMSFRVWQCGGSLETIPCSRVGHVFRNFHPYKFPKDKDTHGINTARLVNVWMDEYKRLFYLYRNELKDSDLIGDITERLLFKKKLGCKSFKWYLDNVYPEKFIPDENVIAYGRVKLKHKNICLDSLQRDEDKPYYLGFYVCHSKIFPSQLLSLSNTGELRREDMCATVDFDKNLVQMKECQDSDIEKTWILTKKGELIHKFTGLCLDGSSNKLEGNIYVHLCSQSAHNQHWKFDFYNKTKIS